MSTRAIPREEWQSFLDGFSRQHQGWLSSVEVRSPGSPPALEAQDQPLTGISADLGDEDAAAIFVSGGRYPNHFTRAVRRPACVRLVETEQGMHQGLDIESGSNELTLLRFRSPAIPELVDGFFASP